MTDVRPAPVRLHFIDAIKAIASQLIVLHHLAFYGPMSDYAQALCPDLISWLAQHARIAVQAFLVMGGFLAAQSLARDGRLTEQPVSHLLWRRYCKLAIPYFCALLLAIAAAAVARALIDHNATPGVPTFMQVIAHLLLLQGIFGFDGLSAGVWYVAIDFQLYALLLIVLWLARQGLPNMSGAGPVCVIALISASLFHFNRDAGWDNWAIYFFGAYGLGAITYWGTQRKRVAWWVVAMGAVTIGALLLDYRSRIQVALLVATSLGVARHTGLIEAWPKSRLTAWLGQISYAVFLTHFPVCLVINALFERFAPHAPAVQLAGMLLAWLASMATGAIFYNAIERRATAPRNRIRS